MILLTAGIILRGAITFLSGSLYRHIVFLQVFVMMELKSTTGGSGYPAKITFHSSGLLLALSLAIQLILAYFLGHAYDMRIFMATGYLAGNGLDPYLARDLSSVFHDSSFRGITTLGYPPPWALVLGLAYLITYKLIPNLLLYNLAIKLPIIAANIGLAFLTASVLKRLGVDERTAKKAWLFLLFNPLLLITTSAWGQFDSIVALLVLGALLLLWEGKMTGSALLLALAVSFKPTALPLIPAVLIFMIGRPFHLIARYIALLLIAMILFCIAPFILFRWDPSPILQHWNAHFMVGGGLTYMSFLELWKETYQLPGLWWLAGWAWLPALGMAALVWKSSSRDFGELLRISTIFILVFFVFRTWLSEPNIMLVLPLVVILVALGELDRRALMVIWILPLLFGIFNTSLFQLFFPSLPDLMNRLLQFSDLHQGVRLVIRTLLVLPWLAVCSWIVITCYKGNYRRRSKHAPGISV